MGIIHIEVGINNNPKKVLVQFNERLPILVVLEDLPLGRTAALVPELAVEDLPLGRTAALVPESAVKDLPLGRTAALVPEFAVKDLCLGRTL